MQTLDKKLMKMAVAAVAILFIIGFIVVLNDRNQLKEKVNQSGTLGQSKDEVQELIDHLGQFLELPTDETPTLATVSNVEQLKTQAFFNNAQNGDKVLLYAKSGKAILYRPSTKKVIEVATINNAGANNPSSAN